MTIKATKAAEAASYTPNTQTMVLTEIQASLTGRALSFWR